MPVVAVIGDGQLARMMQTAAIELGLAPRVLAADDNASAAQVFGDVRIGDYRDLADLQAIAEGADAVTFDHEHVPNEYAHMLIDAGINVEPRPHALLYAQDKLEQRARLTELGAPVPPFSPIASAKDASDFFERVGGRVCLKSRRGGYDGHGVWFPDSLEAFTELVEKLVGEGVELYAEEKVPFVRELSAMVARNRSGEVKAWPVVESRQADGVCRVAISPAPGLDAERAAACQGFAVKIAEALDVTGVLAVELFETADAVLVNELAMRPHNTGHWTQDGCVTSQFEQHLRAVIDWPLGSTEPTAPYTVMVNTLGGDSDPAVPMRERVAAVMKKYPEAKVHLYGKGYRPGRKMGHVNVADESLERALDVAEDAAHYIINAQWR
ncbi:5-(carboxyamino)imidazole ribonucleotide synthase [Corynebacterium liangguodongii]|uniref:N5-carboxyaminoimidazole ribonucleotide synthase n=1 Tax=Corynebacterium liangguodongii TaxID=2079535 RepID=A0A2S0WH03_9CORY|nr:5-(carboxyamino)imidazole ribonucleotide synthase [Corynebacterium liangguodongii]AWB85004.1 5-(carboxyamino)imidazole ribonucleotide synthase [Corynebacterium liangguodongii]PWC00385.1 5-(carboxyamino)imidazole ribonucleotide synthase [Corynebacterium liangguodongii]